MSKMKIMIVSLCLVNSLIILSVVFKREIMENLYYLCDGYFGKGDHNALKGSISYYIWSLGNLLK